MELLGLLLFLLLLWLIIGPIAALVGVGDAKRRCARAEAQVNQLRERCDDLNAEMIRLRTLIRRGTSPADQPELPGPVPLPETAPLPEPVPAPMPEAAPVADLVRTPEPEVAVGNRPPPLPPGARRVVDRPRFIDPPVPAVTAGSGEAEPPEPEGAAAGARPPLNLEQFMGVKLFAWLGGVALFFGIIFFVKYAFDNNLIPPAMRIAMGYVTGAGLLVGGLVLHRRGTHPSLSHSLCATAVLVLYGVTFAAYERYGFFNQAGAFALMVLVTVAAFLIAVRLNALVVAVLGMAGGFLTPVLVSTGKDELLILTGYIALLVAGLIAVSRYRNWRFLVTAAVVGTLVMQLGWFEAHFATGGYRDGWLVWQPMAAMFLFEGLFLTAAWLERRRGGDSLHPDGAALVMAGAGLLFAFALLDAPAVARRMELLFGYLLLQQALVLVLVWLRPRLLVAEAVSGALGFLHLAVWTGLYLDSRNLGAVLALYLLFGALHAVVPLVLIRRAPEAAAAAVPRQVWAWVPVVPLLLTLLCLGRLPEPLPLVWPAILVFNVLVMVLVPRTGTVLPALGGMVATLLLAVVWLFNVPATGGSLVPFLGIALGFAALFGAAGRWLGPRFTPAGPEDAGDTERVLAAAMPVAAGLMPFGLLLLAIFQLPVADPSPVFGAGLLLTALLLGLGVLDRKSALVPTACAGMLAVQAWWHLREFDPAAATVPLVWDVGCYLLFLGFPFAFRAVFAQRVLPWITAALSGIGYFLLVHDLVKRAYPAMSGMMGLLPGAFAVPSLVALVVVVRMAAALEPVKRSQLAWFGGVALLFITLVFPIQFDRQWLTVSWALEGALLLWLFRRVPHPGLQLTGLGLLAIAFVRLAVNPAVVTAYGRSAVPILNWHLYTYGIVAASQFMGALWFTDPGNRLAELKPKAVLYTLCGILLFLLLNLEIADFFTPREQRVIVFGTDLNLARDMTYSIAWGLFSLGLLVIGIWRKARPARYAAIGLLGVTLLKLFLHDLASLASVFRIGALIGVAVIAFVASFLYQQFFNRSKPS